MYFLSPHFTPDGSSFKLLKAKASTFRMVAFAELGVDCVYTLEVSLAGLAYYNVDDINQLLKNTT
jgi:hypothetical protein